ncbi:hypothetical protein GGI07_003527, partial [Coemansia sp. Benny D115]
SKETFQHLLAECPSAVPLMSQLFPAWIRFASAVSELQNTPLSDGTRASEQQSTAPPAPDRTPSGTLSTAARGPGSPSEQRSGIPVATPHQPSSTSPAPHRTPSATTPHTQQSTSLVRSPGSLSEQQSVIPARSPHQPPTTPPAPDHAQNTPSAIAEHLEALSTTARGPGRQSEHTSEHILGIPAPHARQSLQPMVFCAVPAKWRRAGVEWQRGRPNVVPMGIWGPALPWTMSPMVFGPVPGVRWAAVPKPWFRLKEVCSGALRQLKQNESMQERAGSSRALLRGTQQAGAGRSPCCWSSGRGFPAP